MGPSLKFCSKQKKQISEKVYSEIPFDLKFTYINARQEFWKYACQIAKQWALFFGGGVNLSFENEEDFYLSTQKILLQKIMWVI